MTEIFANLKNCAENERCSVRVSGDFAGVVPLDDFAGEKIYNFNNGVLLPGFADVHVHLRQPGFSYKETIATGTLAAARGGFTAVGTMPNVNPVPDSVEHLKPQTDIIDRDAVIDVYPYGAITAGEEGRELSDMEALAPKVLAFSDDGRGVQDRDRMRAAMEKAKSLNKIIAAHCEDMSYLPHDSRQSEWRQIERDVELAYITGCAYHVCHISCRESAEIIRAAKAGGVDVTCETAPHYLTLNDDMTLDSGRFKMNPPIRRERDRLALIDALSDGTIDMIATDHAPHAAREKAGGMKDSANGVVGLETAFSVLYTKLVRRDRVISLQKLMELMAINPRKRFGLPIRADDFTVFDLDNEYIIDPEKFLSMGRSTPFEGERVFGRCLLTVKGGKTVWHENLTER